MQVAHLPYLILSLLCLVVGVSLGLLLLPLLLFPSNGFVRVLIDQLIILINAFVILSLI